MAASNPDAQIAIVGDGIAGLITFGVMRHAGVSSEDICVYGDSPSPLSRITSFARAVGQRTMRSESNGHLRPVDAPGLAVIDAWRRRSPVPLLQSLLHLYAPPLDLLESDGLALERDLGFVDRRIRSRVGRIRRVEAPDGFAFYDSAGELLGTARHVVLALGHPGLAWPLATEGWQQHPRVAHAYMAPEVRQGEHVVVIGSGMAAAHAWLRALERGARVTALHRRPLRRQRLNAPRCAFSASMLDNFRQLEPSARRAFLQQRRGGSYPWRARWEWRLWQARRGGRFETRQDELARIESVDEQVMLQLASGATLRADRLICATGFEPDVRGHALIDDLVTTYELPMYDGMLVPDERFALPEISRPGSICVVAGVLSRWAIPIADTFMGMKFAARRFTPLLQDLPDMMMSSAADEPLPVSAASSAVTV